MNVLIIINDAPYGSEKMYNALRLAIRLPKENEQVHIRVFLMADAVIAALPNQNTPNGYYNIERMLQLVLNHGGSISTCSSCAEARGLKDLEFIKGVEAGSMSQLAQWTLECEKIVVF